MITHPTSNNITFQNHNIENSLSCYREAFDVVILYITDFVRKHSNKILYLFSVFLHCSSAMNSAENDAPMWGVINLASLLCSSGRCRALVIEGFENFDSRVSSFFDIF
ncbi:uncharacterized protein LOC130729246 isoform X3 [Lotus japonicus]|uniref:uncharacterized protein LOC130729246 isoform X3 n=2 Tax=Lotus japonicus TaxID=34305 RepID=UPI00258BD95A|nr:uncharacterized protein LOC130729246 isoform X3 [Lotus japonicus]